MDVKKEMRKKKPYFTREGSKNSVRIGKKWRRPRGLQSKMKHQAAGHRAKVKVGYRYPVDVRHLDREGYFFVRVSTLAELRLFDPKVHKIIISSNVGLKKRLLLLEKAAEKEFKIFRYKDPLKKIEELKDKLKSKKVITGEKKKLKKEKKEKAAKKKPELEEKVLTAEDKKKKDQKEMEKVITKR